MAGNEREGGAVCVCGVVLGYGQRVGGKRRSAQKYCAIPIKVQSDKSGYQEPLGSLVGRASSRENVCRRRRLTRRDHYPHQASGWASLARQPDRPPDFFIYFRALLRWRCSTQRKLGLAGGWPGDGARNPRAQPRQGGSWRYFSQW